jgi:hypothetical protein
MLDITVKLVITVNRTAQNLQPVTFLIMPPLRPTASANNTGSALIGFAIFGPATAPTGTCPADYGGALAISKDLHGTGCPVGGGSWTTKF